MTSESAGAGAVRISYLIIDDLYNDPHAVRNAALHTDYARSAQGANYPGDKSRLHGSVLVPGPTTETSQNPGFSRREHE